jgi:hypothetical protein
MMTEQNSSIFKAYFNPEPFVDRYLNEPETAVDVILPVIHSNELWQANLNSFFREIPINRLLIGDGGCIDDTISIAQKYPRVVVFDHRQLTTLGYSERLLIEAVETEWFIHLHSDVFLPKGWFDIMHKYQDGYDWFGCIERSTIMVEVDSDYGDRPWAGAQFGRKSAFMVGLQEVDDDFIYRQGDWLYRLMIERVGLKEGFVRDTFHYHQTMFRKSPWFRKVTSVRINVEMSPEEKYRTWNMELRGSIKYLDPSMPWAVHEVYSAMQNLLEMKKLDWSELKTWTAQTNRVWIRYVSRQWFGIMLFRSFLSKLFLTFVNVNEKTPRLIPGFVRHFIPRKD